MEGIKIRIKTKDNYARTMFFNTLVGRISFSKQRRGEVAYYYPGILDNTNFCMIDKDNVFVEKISTTDFQTIRIFGNCSTTSYDFYKLDKLKTGREICSERAWKKKLKIKEKKRKWLMKPSQE